MTAKKQRSFVETLDARLRDLADEESVTARTSALRRVARRFEQYVSGRPVIVGDIYPHWTAEAVRRLSNLGVDSVEHLCSTFESLGLPLVVERFASQWETARANHFYGKAGVVSASNLVHLPAGDLVVRLCMRWRRDEAEVLADWCEERLLPGFARPLRFGPSVDARRAIVSLLRGLDLPTVTIPHAFSRVRRQALASLNGWLEAAVTHERERVVEGPAP